MNSYKVEKNQNKSFSHALRHLMGLSVSHSSNLENEAMETDIREIDIRVIAQKHDLGEPLSDREINFLLTYSDSALSGRSFLHQETIQALADAFTSFVKSHCYAANYHTIHVFKKFNLINVAFGEKEGEEAVVSLLSRGFYFCMEEVAEDFQAKLKAHPNPLEDPSIIESLKAFVSCLVYFSQGKEEHIISPVSFREALQPYLSSLIQIAKKSFCREEEATPPFHTPSQNLFVHQHGLEKPFYFHSKHYHCHIWANDLADVHASFIFEKKSATLSLGFSTFDDLLEMAHYVSRFASFKKQAAERDTLQLETSKLSFLWSSEGEGKISSLLRTQNSSFMLDGEETQEFIEFLLEISNEFSEPLKALRYQLGSL